MPFNKVMAQQNHSSGKQSQPKPLWKAILITMGRITVFQFIVIVRYFQFNRKITGMAREGKEQKWLSYRSHNLKLISLFVVAPYLIGLCGASYYVHESWDKYERFVFNLTRPISRPALSDTVWFLWKRVKFFFVYFPVRTDEVGWLFSGYFFASLGSAFLWFGNSAFRSEEKTKKFFVQLGYIDANSKPWDVAIIPGQAVYLNTFHCDIKKLCENGRLWSLINFPPSEPIPYKDDMNKLLAKRQYELPDQLIFDLKPENKAGGKKPI